MTANFSTATGWAASVYFFTKTEAAEILGCSVAAIDALHTDGNLKIVRVCRAKILVEAETVSALMGLKPEKLARLVARAEPDWQPDVRIGVAQCYFIGSDKGPVKIGHSTNPMARLCAIQTGYPHKLRVLAVREGGVAVERAYHDLFAAHRLQGEWFERHPDILAEIKRLNATPARPRHGG